MKYDIVYIYNTNMIYMEIWYHITQTWDYILNTVNRIIFAWFVLCENRLCDIFYSL